MNQDNSQSWVRISYGTIKYVVDSNQDNTEILADPQEERVPQTSTKVVAARSKAKAKPQQRELVDTPTILPMYERRWIDIEPSQQNLASYDLSKKVVNLLRHNQTVQREEDGAIEFYRITFYLRSHSSQVQHWSDDRWKACLAAGGGSKRRFQYCSDNSGRILYLRALQGHSGNNLGQTPETFTGRILFMSMFNDNSCDRKGNKDECLANAGVVKVLARRFRVGQWSFIGPGSEKKWYSAESSRQGAWDNIAEEMLLEFAESGHPIFHATTPLSRGILKSKGRGKLSIHFAADEFTIDTIFSHYPFCQSAQYLRSSGSYM